MVVSRTEHEAWRHFAREYPLFSIDYFIESQGLYVLINKLIEQQAYSYDTSISNFLSFIKMIADVFKQQYGLGILGTYYRAESITEKYLYCDMLPTSRYVNSSVIECFYDVITVHGRVIPSKLVLESSLREIKSKNYSITDEMKKRRLNVKSALRS